MRRKIEYRTGSKETYHRWKQDNPQHNLSYNEYCNIVYTYMYNFRDYLLDSGNKAKLPHGIGAFAISKKKCIRINVIPSTGEEKVNLPVDWAKTKKAGKYIYHMNYHTEGYKFKWKWFPYSGQFYKADVWSFKPSRITSRLLTFYLKEDKQCQHRYKEWDLIKY